MEITKIIYWPIFLLVGCSTSSTNNISPSREIGNASAIIILEKNNVKDVLYRSPEGLNEVDTIRLSEIHNDLPHLISAITQIPAHYIINKSNIDEHYKMIYYPGRDSALTEFKRILGIDLVEEEIELDVCAIFNNGNLKIESVPRAQINNDFQSRWSKDDDNIYHFNGVTIDELAKYLDAKFNTIVINKSNLTEYYKFSVWFKNIIPPTEGGKNIPLGDTGLYMNNIKYKLKVYVIKK